MALLIKYETAVRYRVLVDSFFGDRIVKGSVEADPETGAPAFNSTVLYDGHPGSNLEPVELPGDGTSAANNLAEGKRRKAAYIEFKGVSAEVLAARRRVLIDGGADLEGALDTDQNKLAKDNAELRAKVAELSAKLAPAAPLEPIDDKEPPPVT